MDEKQKFVRDCAILLEEYAKYADYLDELLENPPKETLRRAADDVADEVMKIWYPIRKQGQ